MSRARDTSKIQTETASSRLALVHEDGLIITNEDIFEAEGVT
jgi:hypothetical protein